LIWEMQDKALLLEEMEVVEVVEVVEVAKK
jgi:hypothetical protein